MKLTEEEKRIILKRRAEEESNKPKLMGVLKEDIFDIQEQDGGSDQHLVGRFPLFVCQHCGHEWDDGNRYYCGCGGPYRIPNPDLSGSQPYKNEK